ncbi:MAG: iron ABC transporter permease [Arcobacteraceae bacterium]
MRYFFIFLSILIVAIAPFYGQIDLSTEGILDNTSMHYQVFWDLRFPRIVLAFLTGGVLGLAGLIFQTVFRNPMSTPFTLGVASGATLFTAIAIVFGIASFVSFFAFIGSLLTILILFAITSKLQDIHTTSLLLVGIALSFFYSACLMVLFFISDISQSYEIVRFTMGSLDTVGFTDVYFMLGASLTILAIALVYKQKIKLLLISYEFAQLKGVDVKKTNYILLFVVSISVGIGVSITGPIGFIGLIVPHTLKTLYKKSSEKLILPIFFYSGVFLVFCDLIARNIGSNSDVPIGVVTSFLGAPFFIYLILSRKK